MDLFFVISGFIICHVALGKPFRTGAFLAKRFFRIYPIYALFLLLALAAFLVSPAWVPGGARPDPAGIVRSFLVLPQPRPPLLFVGWSLEHEALFYLIAAFVFALGRPRLLAPLLLALFLAGAAMRLAVGEVWDWHLLSPFQFQFAIGVLVYLHQARLRRLGVVGPLLAGSAFFLASAWVFQGGLIEAWRPVQAGVLLSLVRATGIGAGLILIGTLNAGATPRVANGRHLPGLTAGLVLLGDASFVLYLSHPFILPALLKLGALAHPGRTGAYLVLAAAALLCCGFAVAFHLAVETPYLRWAHRLAPPRQPAGLPRHPGLAAPLPRSAARVMPHLRVRSRTPASSSSRPWSPGA